MSYFWNLLPRPFSVLAPMDDVTDVVFREVVAEAAPPDVFFTEFINCDALFSAGREAHIHRLAYTPLQRPIVAQIWGANPETYFKTAQLAVTRGVDGIDINMGCPDKNVMKTGACSALIGNRSLAAEIIAATKEGAGSVPVSVKTRLGIEKIETESWVSFLLEQDIAALTLHARTVRDMSRVPARWEEITRAVAVRNASGTDTVIIGNGDVMSWSEAQQRAEESGAEGIMIGRGIFHNLWIFDSSRSIEEASVADRLQLLRRHVQLFRETWGDAKNPALMKKFLKAYVADFRGAKELRATYMAIDSLGELEQAIAATEQAL